MQKGAEIDPRNRLGRTPLDFASNRGHVAVMERLLEEGARIEAADKFGVTALMAACRMGNLESAKCLLHRGADILARNGIRRDVFLDPSINMHGLGQSWVGFTGLSRKKVLFC